MKIASHQYQVFYRELKAKFIKKELQGALPKNLREDSPALWDEPGISGNVDIPAAYVLFSGRRTEDPRYFYRKHIELNPKFKSEGILDDLAMLRALEFIDLKILNGEITKNQTLQKKLKHLFNSFVEQFKAEIQAERDNDESRDEDNSNGSKLNECKLVDQETSEAKAVITQFYDHLVNFNFERAWNLMSSFLQAKAPWYGDYERFRRLFDNSNGISDILTFSVHRKSKDLMECLVFFKEEISVQTNKELISLDALTIENFAEYAGNIASLKSKLKNVGVQELDLVVFNKLTTPFALEYLGNKCELDIKAVSSYFPISKTITRERIDKCVCRFNGKNWRITNIQSNIIQPLL